MAGEPFSLSIDDIYINDFPTDYIYSVTSVGLTISDKTGAIYRNWTYSGSNQFLGFSRTRGATTVQYGIGSTGYFDEIPMVTSELYLYSVEGVKPSTYYKVSSADLKSVADAIRAKSGTSESLVYPNGFISAIENIV